MKKLLVIAALALAACSTEPGQTTTQPAATSTPAPQTQPAQPETPTAPKEEPVKPTTAATFEMKIDGMMCEHCQATVTKLITGVAGVESARVDYKTGKAIVTAKPGANLSEAKLREAVEQDYVVESCTKVAQ